MLSAPGSRSALGTNAGGNRWHRPSVALAAAAKCRHVEQVSRVGGMTGSGVGTVPLRYGMTWVAAGSAIEPSAMVLDAWFANHHDAPPTDTSASTLL